jgi:GNAT superfamily N-acetyltransferase
VTVHTGDQAARFPPIRQLTPDDRERCVALALDRGWSPESAKWTLLLAASEVFGVDAPDGRGLAGSVTLTRWGPDLAAVGMMLVASRYGRQGLGRALMEHLLRAAGPDATVTLFATDMGRPLYEQLGFRPVRRNVSFVGRFRPPGRLRAPAARLRPAVGRLRPGARPADHPGPAAPAAGAGLTRDNSKKRETPARDARDARAGQPGTVRPATEADLSALFALDRGAFGADRGRILTRLPGFADHIAVYHGGQGDEAGPVSGYAAGWRNGPVTTVIGPLVAPDAEAARQLVTDLAVRARMPVRLDLDPDRAELPGWLVARGLEPVGQTLVMAHGDAPRRGIPEHLFTPISVALA